MDRFVEKDKTYDAYRYSNVKVIVFVIPGVVKPGVQSNEIRFPWAGNIVDVYASLTTPGTTETTIRIEKCSQADIDGTPAWFDVLSTPLTIDPNEKSSKTADVSSIIGLKAVGADDHLRIVIDSAVNGSRDLTIEVKIKLK